MRNPSSVPNDGLTDPSHDEDMNMKRTRLPLTLFSLVGAAALLTGCAGSSPSSESTPALTVAPETTASTQAAPTETPASSAPADTNAPAGNSGALPGPIVAIEYEIDETPGNDDDDDDGTTTDSGHIAELTSLLEQYGITSDYESDDDDCDDEWEVDVDAKINGHDSIEIDIETCNPTEFEQQLLDLVQTWT